MWLKEQKKFIGTRVAQNDLGHKEVVEEEQCIQKIAAAGSGNYV